MKKIQIWRSTSKLQVRTNEKEIFAQLHQILKTGQCNSPGTFWSKFSLSREAILTLEGVDIKDTGINARIHMLLRLMGAGHKAMKTFTFTKEEVKSFLKAAPLAMLDAKLVLIIGVYTGLRCETIAKLEWKNVNLTDTTVRNYVGHESKTDQCVTDHWFAFPRQAGNSKPPYSLLSYLSFIRVFPSDMHIQLVAKAKANVQWP